jgi:cell division protein FtsB
VATTAGLGFYLLYRKFEAERAASLREDNKTLRDENKELREENRQLRAELKGDDA